MPLDERLLAVRLKNHVKELKIWERIMINLYVLGGFDEPVKLVTVRDACYNGELTPDRRKNLYGTVLRSAEKLRINGNLKRYNNPVRYQLVHSRDTAGFLASIARELGFPNARTEDFL